jgi:uncharacterized membrane protein YraQ (UPF0718 family)
MGKSAWWSLPAAVLIGIPVYSNVSAMIPVIQAFLFKGASLGTTLAFLMSTTALSLPEFIILRKVLKTKLIFILILIVTIWVLIMGFLLNWII